MSVVIFINKNYHDDEYVKTCLNEHEFDEFNIYIWEEDNISKRYLEEKGFEFVTFEKENYKHIIKKCDEVILFFDGSEFTTKVKNYTIKKDISIDIYEHEENVLYEKVLESQEKYVNSAEDDIEFEDEEFDAIVDYCNKKKKTVSLIGAKALKDEIKLPYPMASINKISYGTSSLKKLTKFMDENPGPYCISSKVDGTSLELIYTYDEEKDKCDVIVATGGDGSVGKDVSFIKDYIDFKDPKMDCVIRGELTINLDDFEEIAPSLREKGRKATNSRNLVNGMVNRKDANPEILEKCFFNAFGIMSSNRKMSKQFKQLKKFGFKTPKPIVEDFDEPEEFLEFLKTELETRNEKRKYRTDGLVIVSESTFYRNEENSNPTCSFAFKMNTFAVTKIKKIKWKVTRYGYLTPIAIVEPVEILGTTMKKVSAVHAKEVELKGIGPGAIVTVTFAGDIIPKIVSCVKKAEPTWPKVDFHWDENEVEIMVDRPEDFEEITILQMNFFLKTLGVKDCGIKRLKMLYENGITKLDKLVRLKEEDMDGLVGFGSKLAPKIVLAIKNGIKRITWSKLMAGSGIFGEGLGEERFEMLISSFPDWRCEDLTPEDLITIPGIGPILSEQISLNLPKFKEWINKNKLCIPGERAKSAVEQDLRGEVIIFTGFTNESLKHELQSRGAIIKDNWVNSATLVVAKSVNANSNKITKAREKGVKVMNIEKFIKKYKSS